MNQLDQAVAQAAQKIKHCVTRHVGPLLRRHPRAVLSTVAVGLMGFAVTAVGGWAPLNQESPLVAQTIVNQHVPLDDLQTQLQTLSAVEFDLYRADITRNTDSVDNILRRLGVRDEAAALSLRQNSLARHALTSRNGHMVKVRTDADGQLSEMFVRYPSGESERAETHFNRLHLVRTAEGFQATVEELPLTRETKFGSARISHSLFGALDEAMLPDNIATQMAEIFSADIDFRRDLRRGDSFSVVYEALVADGEPVAWGSGTGRILAIEFINKDEIHTAVWYSGDNGKGGYFDLQGQNKRRAFLSSPVKFSRISSGFAQRLHPIFRTWRQHTGVDYAAPSGTPVHSVGEGTVEFSGWQNGYGNVVSVKHSQNRSTLYAHLSRIDVRMGARVDAGDRIGTVGSTGWATGPHLHFELKVKGIHQDPMIIARLSETATVPANAKAQFVRYAKAMHTKLQIGQSVAVLGNRSE